MKSIALFNAAKISDPTVLSNIKGGRITGKVGGGTLGNGQCYEDVEVDGPSGSTIVCYAVDGTAPQE